MYIYIYMRDNVLHNYIHNRCQKGTCLGAIMQINWKSTQPHSTILTHQSVDVWASLKPFNHTYFFKLSLDSSVWTACVLVSRDCRHRDRTCGHSTVHAYHTSILRIAQNQHTRGSQLTHKCCLFSYNDIKYFSSNLNIFTKYSSLTYSMSPYLASPYIIPTMFSFVNFKSRLSFLNKLLCLYCV